MRWMRGSERNDSTRSTRRWRARERVWTTQWGRRTRNESRRCARAVAATSRRRRVRWTGDATPTAATAAPALKKRRVVHEYELRLGAAAGQRQVTVTIDVPPGATLGTLTAVFDVRP